MAKARAIVKRRKAVRNIRKITKTMQMIATAKFQKALKRAVREALPSAVFCSDGERRTIGSPA